MGAVSRPDAKARRQLVEELLRDLDPDVKEAVRKIIEGGRGEDMEGRLRELIGLRKTMELIERTR